MRIITLLALSLVGLCAPAQERERSLAEAAGWVNDGILADDAPTLEWKNLPAIIALERDEGGDIYFSVWGGDGRATLPRLNIGPAGPVKIRANGPGSISYVIERYVGSDGKLRLRLLEEGE